MIVTTLNDVAPQDYDIQGNRSWMDTVQWKAGETYDVDSTWADWFCGNGDAVMGAPEDTMDDIVNGIDARNVERKMKVANLVTAIRMGVL